MYTSQNNYWPNLNNLKCAHPKSFEIVDKFGQRKFSAAVAKMIKSSASHANSRSTATENVL